MKLYDKNAVAKFLDMTPKNVQRLTEKGILQTKQGGLYSLAEATHAYIKYLRDRNPENEENIDLNEERAEDAEKLATMTDKAKIFVYLNGRIKEALAELSNFEEVFKEEIKEDEEGND